MEKEVISLKECNKEGNVSGGLVWATWQRHEGTRLVTQLELNHWPPEECATCRAEARQILSALGPAHAVLVDRLAAKIAAYG